MKDYYKYNFDIKTKYDLLKTIINQLPAIVHINDIQDYNKMIVKWINESVKPLSGYELEDVIDQPDFVSKLMNVGDLKEYISVIEPILENVPEKYVTAVYRINSKDGKIKWMKSYSNIFETDKNGNSLLGLAIAVNIDKEIHNIIKLQKSIYKQKSQIQSLLSKNLTDNEKTVISYIKKGYTLKEIALTLNRSYETIVTHKKKIFKKLKVKNIPELLKVVYKFDLE